FFSSRRRHTRSKRDWSSDVCSSDLGGETWGIACALHSAQNSPPRCESSLLVRGWRIRLNGVHQLVFRFSRDPEGASGGSSSRLFAFLLHWGTADEPPPKDAGGRGRDRQSAWRPESAGRQDSKSIRRRRQSRPSGVHDSSHVPKLRHRFAGQTLPHSRWLRYTWWNRDRGWDSLPDPTSSG